jgi:hypothetical protein
MVLLPTLNRPDKLKNTLASMIETQTSTPGLLLIDEGDYEWNETKYLALELPEGWKIQITKARGMGGKVREIWPLIRDHSFVGLIGDDNICKTQSWDKRLIRQLTGKNFISCNDNYQAPARSAGCTIWSMPLLECVGWPIFPPQLEHLGIDDCWELLGRTTGCWTVDMSVLIEHAHVFTGAPMDETHKITYGAGAWENSPASKDVSARLELFHMLEFKAAIEKISAFSGQKEYFKRD